jgi:CSLREA domain-containing protein
MASQIAAVFILALAFLAAGIDTSAATLVVTKTADTADGICDSDCSLREAVTAAAGGDSVVFSSLFNEPQTITLISGQITITRNLTMTGPGHPLLTISGNNASRIFVISGGPTVCINGIRFANGSAPTAGAIGVVGSALDLRSVAVDNNHSTDPNSGTGGGILVNTGTLTVSESIIKNNTVPPNGIGGGIYVFSSTLNLADSSVSYNTGGGINGGGSTTMNSTLQFNGSGILGSVSVTTIDNSVISDNRFGVACQGQAVISNSIIRNNNTPFQPGARGAGLWINGGGPVFILNTSIINNTAFESGGGIYNLQSQLYLTNSTVSGNLARNGTGQNPCAGGGIHNAVSGGTGTVVLTNTTVASNSAQGRGGGICNDTGGTVISRNSIVAGNTGGPGPDFYGVVSSEGNNLIGNTAGSSGWMASDLQNLDRLLAPLGIHITTLCWPLISGESVLSA